MATPCNRSIDRFLEGRLGPPFFVSAVIEFFERMTLLFDNPDLPTANDTAMTMPGSMRRKNSDCKSAKRNTSGSRREPAKAFGNVRRAGRFTASPGE
jgi:hypothetical protein